MAQQSLSTLAVDSSAPVPESIIRRMPKVELHDHLDGGLRPQTIVELASGAGIELPEREPSRLAAWFMRGADRKSLALYLEGFACTIAVMQEAAAIERVAREAIEDLATDGVVYAELRFAPALLTARGLDMASVIEAALRGFRTGQEATGTEWGLILCGMRTMPPAVSLETARLAVEYRDRGVVGFDLAGDEKGHPPKRHLEAFQLVRQGNFNITIHAGEAYGPESIWQALQTCGAHRIGHGTRLAEDLVSNAGKIAAMGSLGAYVRDRRIPLECCLSSNVQTGAAPSYAEHPFGLFYRNGFRVSLCTDNRLMSGTSQSREMTLASTAFGLNLRDLEKLVTNAMKSSFAPYEHRLRVIYERIKPGFAALRGQALG